MRKLSLLLVLSFFISNVYAVKYSDKSYLSVRPHLTNLAMQQTTWHTNLYRRPDAKYNGTIQIVPFYQESDNKTDIGKYFGFDWGGTRGIENIISVESPDPAVGPNGTNRVFSALYIIHDRAGSIAAADRIQARYEMKVYQEVLGARLDYHQDLDKILDGLYFRVSTPIVEVKNHFNTSALETETPQQIPGMANTSVTFLDYLAGKVENISANNLQDPLKYAKIDGGRHTSSGFADVDVRIGWKYWYKKRLRAGMSISLLVPTGKTPKGEWLFEPVHGNGHHWGIGGALDGVVTFWRRDNKSVEFMLNADYKYLFQGIEKRTLDFREPDPNNVTYLRGGYYVLGGQNQVAGTFPLANVLTRDIKVTPAHQFDGIAALNINLNNWIIDLGYNIFAKVKEEVHLRHPWENDKYAVAGVTYNTANVFNLLVNGTTQSYAYNGAANGTNAAIQEQYLDFDAIKSPNAVTHKIFGGIGYQWNQYKYPAMFGIGGSYEFVQRNSALEGWSVWTKLGISW
ncbi:hypothetical protein GF385_01535 [Candidatus Dependentiae bacterium]|nr:hypothetical protein [Candidatus Dependentiae bacterium]